MSYRTNRRTGKKFKISRDAREYISEKIAILLDEGYSRSRAIAVAYDYARREGYRIPQEPRKKKRRDGYVPFASVAESISKRAD